MEINQANIKSVFKENFSRDLNDEEASEIIDKLREYTHTINKRTLGFSEVRLKQYLRNIEISFSPNAIFQEVNKILNCEKPEEFKVLGKYKRTREMLNAAWFSIALNKIYTQKWFIKPQDSPDIILAHHNSKDWLKKNIDAIKLEIMSIPQIIKDGWYADIEFKIAKFIEEKKFKKRFGRHSHLLVSLNFNCKGLNIEKVSNEIKLIENNPFNQIWVIADISPDMNEYMVSMVYPELSAVKINKISDDELFY